MMQPYQYQRDPSVPGCCCTMPSGARVVGIIEIVLSVLYLIGGIYNVARSGNYFSIAAIVFAVGTIVCSIFLMNGASRRDPGKFIPYMIWKPLMLAIQLAGLILSGVKGEEIWRETAAKQSWKNASERQTADTIFRAVWGVVLAFASIYIIVGIINLYVVIMCYKHLKANPHIPHPVPAVAYTYGQAPATVVVGAPAHGQHAPHGYGPQQGYGYPQSGPPPAYGYDNRGMEDTVTFDKK